MPKLTPPVVLFVATLLGALGCLAFGEREIALMLILFATGHAVQSPFKRKPSELNPTPGIERVDGEQ
jgi:hypothetical protein